MGSLGRDAGEGGHAVGEVAFAVGDGLLVAHSDVDVAVTRELHEFFRRRSMPDPRNRPPRTDPATVAPRVPRLLRHRRRQQRRHRSRQRTHPPPPQNRKSPYTQRGIYTVIATSHCVARWSGYGRSGEIALDLTKSRELKVGEFTATSEFHSLPGTRLRRS